MVNRKEEKKLLVSLLLYENDKKRLKIEWLSCFVFNSVMANMQKAAAAAQQTKGKDAHTTWL